MKDSKNVLDYIRKMIFCKVTDLGKQQIVILGLSLLREFHLCSPISSLYNHPGKADILEQLILELENSLRTTGQYPGRDEKEPPSTLMWTLFLLAQHYDRRGQYEIAISKINEAIEHTPTVIDLYSVKLPTYKNRKEMEKGDYENWKSTVLASNEKIKKKACKRTTQTSLQFFKEAPETKKLEVV